MRFKRENMVFKFLICTEEMCQTHLIKSPVKLCNLTKGMHIYDSNMSGGQFSVFKGSAGVEKVQNNLLK